MQAEDQEILLDYSNVYEYAKDGGYTGTEEMFAQKLAAEYLSTGGGTMEGPVNMNGQSLSGLNAPVQDDEAATKGYADDIGKESEKKALRFYDVVVPASSFVSDSTNVDFPFRAAIALSGVTGRMIPDVYFDFADAVSGNFAPFSAAYDGGVYIYAAEQPTAGITIPVILCRKEE